MAAKRNKTMTLSADESKKLGKKLVTLKKNTGIEKISNKVINQDIFQAAKFLPEKFIDLLFIDPPYNIKKSFGSSKFTKITTVKYQEWMRSWLELLIPMLKETASIYICGDWRSSTAIHLLCEEYFTVQNRITFEREKGRGSLSNWKNNSEDIWFCTKSKKYCFNPDDVKLKKKVIAPYKENGQPKDWNEETTGNFRLTFASNVWTDITIPFWSMSENTPHPTQKPEKLLAKIILASSNVGDFVFDPFAGVGTTGVVAKKLNRKFAMVELEKEFCLFALKRLELAESDASIQGYFGEVFWERNSLSVQKKDI